MPFLFIVLGVVFTIASVRDTVSDFDGNKGLATLLHDDFTGDTNFIYWFISILLIGALGYIKPLEPVSRAFLALVVIILLLSNKGVFAQFNEALSGKLKVS